MIVEPGVYRQTPGNFRPSEYVPHLYNLAVEENRLELKIKDVSKAYKGGFLALKDFTLTLKPGVLGLLGPNGAGKSTLMNILATITRATGGSVTWNGMDIAAHPNDLRAVLGYLPQDFGMYPNLNAVEFFENLAGEPSSGGDAITATPSGLAGFIRSEPYAMKHQGQGKQQPFDFTQWLQQYAEHLLGICTSPHPKQPIPVQTPKPQQR
jgi:ABC-type bacteriocin/lantibiotic exporter with double-glycine peptidase domain